MKGWFVVRVVVVVLWLQGSPKATYEPTSSLDFLVDIRATTIIPFQYFTSLTRR